jgi:hypothetical protein
MLHSKKSDGASVKAYSLISATTTRAFDDVARFTQSRIGRKRTIAGKVDVLRSVNDRRLAAGHAVV